MVAKRLGPTISWIWFAISTVSTIIGWIGIPQDIRDWGVFLGMINADVVRWILLIIGLGGLVTIFVLFLTGRAFVTVPEPEEKSSVDCRFCNGSGRDPSSVPPFSIMTCRICQGKGKQP